MKTIEELAALGTEKWSHFGGDWFACKPPTPESVAHIEKTFKIALPRDFIRYCELTPNYGVGFGSIGDDYSSHNHLLKLNEEFHNAGETCFSLPANYILINHGHDDDCECFDISAGSGGEYPIFYICPGDEGTLIAKTFREYLEEAFKQRSG